MSEWTPERQQKAIRQTKALDESAGALRDQIAAQCGFPPAQRDWSGSINKPGAHSFYATSKVTKIAEQILFSQSATENERLLADCIIALNGGIRQ
jgi:hypothetical protein